MRDWSSSWKGSIQPRKQRKYVANAPMHVRRKFVSVHLDKKLREQYKIRAFPVRKGDTVKILRGSRKGLQGKVASVSLSRGVVYIEGQTRESISGKKILVPFNPSNLMIIELKLDDKKREKSLLRKLNKNSTEIGMEEKKNASKKTKNT